MPEKHPRSLDHQTYWLKANGSGNIWLKFMHLDEGMVVSGAVVINGDKDFQKWYRVEGGQLVAINPVEYKEWLKKRPWNGNGANGHAPWSTN